MQNDQQMAIREALATLARTYAIVVEQIEGTIRVLTKALEAAGQENMAPADGMSSGQDRTPYVDRATLSIQWQGKICFLGNTILLKFFERIAQSPNRYVPHADLLEDVWGGTREVTTIRGVVKRLRDRLAKAGMQDLAEAIDGRVAGYYRLTSV